MYTSSSDVLDPTNYQFINYSSDAAVHAWGAAANRYSITCIDISNIGNSLTALNTFLGLPNGGVAAITNPNTKFVDIHS